jgi:hypothetical protein
MFRDGAFIWKKDMDSDSDFYLWNKVLAVTATDRQGNRRDASQGQSYRAIVNMIIPNTTTSVNGAGVALEIQNPDSNEICCPCLTISDRVDGLTLTMWDRDGNAMRHQKSEPALNLVQRPGASVKLEIQYIRSRRGENAQVVFLCDGRKLNWQLPTFAGPNTTVNSSMFVAGSGEFRFLSMAVYT